MGRPWHGARGIVGPPRAASGEDGLVGLRKGDWRLTRMMKQADLIYNEDNLLQILKGLEAKGNWRQAVAVAEWVAYNENSYKHRRSRFVYTKLLSILGKAWMPTEVLNACVLSQQWKGVFWVFQKMRFGGLTPTGRHLALVMLKSKKYEFVKFFEKDAEKVLVRAFWEQGKVNEAVEAVKDMEQRGVVGAATVYYELLAVFAIKEGGKMLYYSLFDGGYISSVSTIFESMKDYCTPNIGTINMTLSQHHLDQSKYSWLLIKASRAGKPYLVEHALDSILERGEIPDVELFTENICQTIAESDYGRTLHLMNTMSAASVNMNEQQWSDLLLQNSHRFRVHGLKDLIAPQY
ncbi:hypothetical protein ZWY2020_025242 [Hordeum vulgare]|nr:hypothetical protein ZWY2020_025242 [Hordeum vulgare]